MKDKEKQEQGVSISPHDLYQILIAELRYGFTRNNHLMPWGAFGHCKEYIPAMLPVDPLIAEHTAVQCAEETISELRMRTISSTDRLLEFGLEKEYADFVLWCLHFLVDHQKEFLVGHNAPYNIDGFEEYLKSKHDETNLTWLIENQFLL